MIRYIFREDEPLTFKNANKANPQKIGQALAKITAEHDGLDPEDVVEAARDPKSPLHQHFEWDDAICADRYRRDQARTIISVVRVVDDSAEEGSTRAFISVKDDAGVSYRTVQEIRSSADLQAIVLKAAKRELETFERRYRELKDICVLIGRAAKMVDQKLSKIENRAAA